MQYKNIMKVARPLLTIFEYALSVLIIAVTAQISFGNTLTTWIITAISVVLAVSTYAVWFTDGVDRAERLQSVYNTTLRFNVYARAISNMQVMDKQKEFCDKKNADFALELTISKLTEHELSLKDLETYKENLKKARIEAIIKPKWVLGKLKIGKTTDLGDEWRNYIKQFSKKQLRLLAYLSEHAIKFDKLEPKDLTKSMSSKTAIKPKNTEHEHLPKTLLSKIIWGVALGLFTASIALMKKGAWTMNETIQVVSWAFSISYNIYASIKAGYKTVSVDRYNYYKDKNELCAEFFGFIGKTVEQIEQDANLTALLKQDDK